MNKIVTLHSPRAGREADVNLPGGKRVPALET